MLAAVCELEHIRLYTYGKTLKTTDGSTSIRTAKKCIRSSRTFSACLPRCMDRLAKFRINVNHISIMHLALTGYSSRNPNAPARNDKAYQEGFVICSMVQHYDFALKNGCLYNNLNQSKADSGSTIAAAANKHRCTIRVNKLP